MRSTVAALGYVGLGAGLMYVLDPDRGKRRRALVRDRAVHVTTLGRHALDKTARDLDHRVRGMLAGRTARRAAAPATDVVLVERVRAKLGRIVTYPAAIEVTATAGRIALSGPILAHELGPALGAARTVHGVHTVKDQLVPYARADNLPGLRDRQRQSARRLEPLRDRWSPTGRLIAIAAGGTLATYGLSRRDRLGTAFDAAGTGLLLRGLSNYGLRRLLGLGVGRRAVAIEKTITVPIPVDDLYALWSQPEHLPRVMAHVRAVRQISDERSRWTVIGPIGLPVRWEAVVTERRPNKLIAWQTVPRSLVRHAGTLRFESRGGEGTRLDLRMTYTPPAGLLGHGLAMLLRADPRHQLDDDLARFKSLLELGRTHVRNEVVTRGALMG